MVPKDAKGKTCSNSPVMNRGLDGTWVLIGLLTSVLRTHGQSWEQGDQVGDCAVVQGG